MPSDESKGSQLDAIGSLAQRQLDNTVQGHGGRTRSPDELFGGFLKYTAMAMGLKSLYLVAFGLYALSVPSAVLRGKT